jgi:hypothetical protein
MYNPRRFSRGIFNVSSDAGVSPAAPIPEPSRLPHRGVQGCGERGE